MMYQGQHQYVRKCKWLPAGKEGEAYRLMENGFATAMKMVAGKMEVGHHLRTQRRAPQVWPGGRTR
jgi:hypothetical protein